MALSIEQQARLIELAETVGALLSEQDTHLVTAESCTGGWIAQAITAIAGSSRWFNSGIVSYSNEVKHKLLGVPESTLQKYGAVSQQTVESMASGAAGLGFGSVSVAVSGVAGPDGGTTEKPVGTVWIGWQVDEIISSQKFLFDGDREQVRYQTLIKALEGLIERLQINFKNTV